MYLLEPTTALGGLTGRGPAAGVDIGATLAKVALRQGDGQVSLAMGAADGLEPLVEHLNALAPPCIGLTGGGALRLAKLLQSDTAQVEEFAAWSTGARRLLRGGDAPERFLLASVGTGTSVVRVGSGPIERVGGTALGGGTIMGLAAALFGEYSFERIAALACEGDRRDVDLLVGEIYRDGGFQLPPELNAASFGKLALARDQASTDPCDLAHALMGMVGENVALLCAALANAAGVEHVVFGGSTLRNNEALSGILRGVCFAKGLASTVLPQGEFAGAIGALEATVMQPAA
jgi:type II pantothenate kinase